MTILDYVLLGIILITFIVGFVKGFIKIIFKMFAWIIIVALTVTLVPKLSPTLENAEVFGVNPYNFIETKISDYVGPKLGEDGDIVLTIPEGVEVDREEIDNVLKASIEKIGVPAIFSNALVKAFQNIDLTNSDLTVKEVIVATTTNFVFKCFVYVAAFVLVFLVITIIFFFLSKLFSFGLLSIPNRLLGGIFSCLIGIIIINILFLLISTLKGVIPQLDSLVNDTLQNGLEITKYFYNNNFILQILSKTFDLEKAFEDILSLLSSNVRFIK